MFGEGDVERTRRRNRESSNDARCRVERRTVALPTVARSEGEIGTVGRKNHGRRRVSESRGEPVTGSRSVSIRAGPRSIRRKAPAPALQTAFARYGRLHRV